MTCTKLGMAVALFCSATSAFAADITISGNYPGSFDTYSSWTSQQLVLSPLTEAVTFSSFTDSATLRDQGWGGSALSNGNGVFANLLVNGSMIWRSATTLGTDRPDNGYDTSWKNPTWTAGAADLSALNLAIAGINWSLNPNVEIGLQASSYGYPGWELHVANASFSGVASAVPLPPSLILFLSGLIGFGALGRKSNATAIMS